MQDAGVRRGVPQAARRMAFGQATARLQQSSHAAVSHACCRVMVDPLDSSVHESYEQPISF